MSLALILSFPPYIQGCNYSSSAVEMICRIASGLMGGSKQDGCNTLTADLLGEDNDPEVLT